MAFFASKRAQTSTNCRAVDVSGMGILRLLDVRDGRILGILISKRRSSGS